MLIEKIEDCVELAKAAGQPYSPKQVLGNAYQLVELMGLYFEDLKK